MTIGGAWLTGPEIVNQVRRGRILITPFSNEAVNPNSYNFTLGTNVKRLTNEVIDFRSEDSWEDLTVPETGLTLMPGECYLGFTRETFGSNYFPALMTGRSSTGRRFLTTHISACLIDLGFFGQLTLELSVIRPTVIYGGLALGQVFWFSPRGQVRRYRGRYQSQVGSTPARRRSANAVITKF